jgi:hypothetical protein
MKAEDFMKEFLAMPEKDQMEVLRGIMPVFCRNMSQNPGKVMDMFGLFTEQCGGEMKNMFNMLGMMMGRKGGGCCG